MTVADDGRLFLSDSFGRIDKQKRVYVVEPPYIDPPVATPIKGLLPAGLLWDQGSLFVCDTKGGTVRRYDSEFNVTSEWTANAPWNIVRMGDGNLLTVSFIGHVERLESDGSATMLFKGLDAPFDLAPARDSGVWISEQGQEAGAVTRRALDGSILESIDYPWANPEGMQIDDDGALWIAETERGEIARVDGDGVAVVARDLKLPVVITRVSPTMLLVNQASKPPKLLRIELAP